MAIVDLVKNQFPIFIDVSLTETPSWKLIGFSTEQSIAMNPQTESVDYICYVSAVEEVRSNNIEIPTNLALKQGDGAFDFVFSKFKSRPTGSDCKVDILVCFPATTGYTGWLATDSTIVLGSISPNDSLIDFSIKLGGTIADGTVTITEGVPVFTIAV